LTISAGSVIADVSIQTYAVTAASVQSTMASATRSPSSATAMLANVTGVSIVVLAVVTPPTVEEIPPPPPPSPSPPPPMSPIGTGEVAAPTVESSGGSLGIIIGVVVGVSIAFVLALVFMRRRRPPASPPARPNLSARPNHKRLPEGPQATKDVQIEIVPSKVVKRVNSPTQLIILQPPDTWAAMKNQQTATVHTAEKFDLPPGPEHDHVCHTFMKTLKNSSIKVVDVQRIQNRTLWNQYALKLSDVVSREGPSSRDRNEKVWLFHGTDEDTVEKIVQQGFNRSFAGKNMTKYGKGVYFARDASCKAAHRMLPIERSPFATCQATLISILSSISRSADSSSTTYSTPNKQGVQHMFLCRVVTGEFCLGQKDAPAPPARTGVILFDSTVDDLADPTIFVTYNDAQAYPEYLVRFRQ
jgi:hypothetical protein